MSKAAEIEPPPLNLGLETWRESREIKHEVHDVKNMLSLGFQVIQKEVNEIHGFVGVAKPAMEALKALPEDASDIGKSLKSIADQLPILIQKASENRSGVPTSVFLATILIMGAVFLLKPLVDVVVAWGNAKIGAEFEGYGVKGSVKSQVEKEASDVRP